MFSNFGSRTLVFYSPRMKATDLKDLVERRMRIRKHSPKWTMSNKIVGTVYCERCQMFAKYTTRPDPKEAPYEGLALRFHCEGNPLTYDEVWEMFDEVGHPRTMPLGPELRLVILGCR